jgi:hypothetical protein
MPPLASDLGVPALLSGIDGNHGDYGNALVAQWRALAVDGRGCRTRLGAEA